MATISLCMIVKNEERCLGTCLDSLRGICDEIIIADTGSTDSTKEIAKRYTNKVYDFEWTGDFSQARNFVFSKASMDYIYTADADEFIDEENRQMFMDLKELILPEIEIVQMIYVEDGIRTVLNTKEELRPKLYKRIRKFTWIDPVHETVRTLPVVFDSDIRIMHRPQNLHSKRDFSLIEKGFEKDGDLSNNLLNMYAREVYKWGDSKDLSRAINIFMEIMKKRDLGDDLTEKAWILAARSARLSGDMHRFLKASSKAMFFGRSSEIFCEMGDYFRLKGEGEEASMWYYVAAYQSESILDADAGDSYPRQFIETNDF